MRQEFPFARGASPQLPRPRGAFGTERLVVEHVETRDPVVGAIAIKRRPSWLRVGAVVAATRGVPGAEDDRWVLFDVRGAVEVRGPDAIYYIVPADAVQTELTAAAVVRPRGATR